MDRTFIVSVGVGALLATALFGGRRAADGLPETPPTASPISSTADPTVASSFPEPRATIAPTAAVAPGGFAAVTDNRYAGLPTSEQGFAPHGYMYVVEQPPTWNARASVARYPVAPRPVWFPYREFLGPPVPEGAVAIDPRGYMFATAEGVRVHRDGWLVTQDGRAFRAKELIDDMGFPQIPTPQRSSTHVQ